MKYKWLNRCEKSNLIIFFNGWGMDEAVVEHLEPSDYQILMFYDYNNLETDFDFNSLNKFKEKYLVAWSMGVMVATLFQQIKYDSSIAINGTLKPIDDKYGIPTKIYDLTEKGLTPLGVKKFIKNMYNPESKIPEIKRNFENQKTQLTALRNYRANNDFKYSKILISKEDKIFPTKNQSAFWNIEPNLEAGHAPFMIFQKWSELI